MAYQPLSVIKCQRPPRRKRVDVLFNPAIPNVGHILVGHAIFWLGWFRGQVYGILSFLHMNCSKVLLHVNCNKIFLRVNCCIIFLQVNCSKIFKNFQVRINNITWVGTRIFQITKWVMAPNHLGTIDLTYISKDLGVSYLSKGSESVIARLVFVLSYYEVTVHHVNYYATETSLPKDEDNCPKKKWNNKNI